MTPRYDREEGPPRDWRGVPINQHDMVLYAQLHNEGSFAEAQVLRTDDPEHRGRCYIEIIRMSKSNASHARVYRQRWVHKGRLTVIDRFPHSPYPFEEDLVPVGERISAERRRAMRDNGPRR